MTPLNRQRYAMPEFVRHALVGRKLMDAYLSRPDYQQNDYVGWITRARLASARERRLNQMLEELEHGGTYMRMKWRPR